MLDASMVGALALYGVPATPATGAKLAYHAISLWIPALIGTLASVRLRRNIASAQPSPLARPDTAGIEESP